MIKDTCINLGLISKTFPSIEYEASTLQHVLHQPTSQQMTGTQWKEINTVVNILNKLSLLEKKGHNIIY